MEDRTIHREAPGHDVIGRRLTPPSSSFKPEWQAASTDSVTEAWVREYGSGLVPGDDFSYALVRDLAGNVYVTGGSGSSHSADYATIKYDGSGVEQWVAGYNGTGNEADVATALAVDADGNVYVTGISIGAGTSFDYSTIKYDVSGVEQWVARYDGPENGYDFAKALAVDADGNVYVAGNSVGSGTSDDYATIKYDASGVEQWVARYNGPGSAFDQAYALSLDADGNVYVTGNSVGSGTSDDYATIKYDASGVEQWVARYNGPGNSYDRATALAVEADGTVCVTGFSWGSGTLNDYTTIQYDASGVEQWMSRYNGPGSAFDQAYALSLDADGNVYVTGNSVGSGTSDDYATIKYDASGVEQWVARYNGPGNLYDYATALTVDEDGNVYVIGNSIGTGTSGDYATIKYDASGVEEWISRYNGPGNSYDYTTAVAVDADGNVYVTGYDYSGTLTDFATLKYNAAGAEQWVARYNGPGNSYDVATALTVEADGNVFVTGISIGAGTSYDYSTIKYDVSGVEQWVARYDGPGNSYDYATALAVDADGNAYVTGYSYSGGSYEYATIKYDASGVEQWVARYHGPGDGGDGASALAVDETGNVYVTGYSSEGSTGSPRDYATIKYDASGVELWVIRYNGTGFSDDFATALAVDTNGNVFVTGGSGTPNYDYATIKYDASGVEQWVGRYNGTANQTDVAGALVLDADGNVHVTGNSVGSGTSDDYATIKYDASGVEQWAARYNGTGNGTDIAKALALDSDGNVYATGNSVGSGTSDDYATIKYDASGVEQWAARYNGTGNAGDVAIDLAVDKTGNAYVTGYSAWSGTLDEYATIKYDASGVEQWVGRYNGPGNSDNNATALAVDADGNVFVTGTSNPVASVSVYTTIKYVQIPTSVEEEPVIPATYSLSQNYPNPFNPSTVIEYSLPFSAYIKLEVYNLLGERVSVLRDGVQDAGYHRAEFAAQGLSSGIYFYRLQAGDFVETKKLILMR